MAALNFPNSPSVNDIHTENGVSFKWNGTIWKKVGASYLDTTNLNVTGLSTFVGNAKFNTLSGAGALVFSTGSGVLDDSANHSISGSTLNTVDIEAQGNITVADKIIHRSDTNTTIRFPSNDTITAETGGSERLRITSDGYVRIGGNEGDYPLVVIDESNRTTTADTQLHLYAKHDGSGTTGVGFGGGIRFWGDRASGNVEQNMGRIMCIADVNTGTTLSSAFTFETGVAGVLGEKVRITSAGEVGINTSLVPYGNFAVDHGQYGLTRISDHSHILLQNKNSTTTEFWNFAPRDDGSVSIGRGVPNANGTISDVKFSIDSSGRLLVKESTNSTGTYGQYGTLQLKGNSLNTNAAILLLATGKNSASNSSGDHLGYIVFGDKQAGEYAYIRGTIDAAPGVGDYPGRIEFHTTANGASSATEKLRIQSAGGISFNGDTAAANALDDYEEGDLSWQLRKSGAQGQGSNNGSVVKYTKVGRMVSIAGKIRTDSTGSNSNDNFFIDGTLPFAPSTNGTAVIGHFRSQDDATGTLTASIAWMAGSSTLYVYTCVTRGDYTANENNVGVNNQTNLVITFSFTYQAS